MKLGKALVIKEFGAPEKVVNLETNAARNPDNHEVLLRILMAPIHPSDFGIILGKYGNLPSLPAVAGREGIAEVVHVGEEVSDLAEGDLTTVPSGVGSWQEMATVPAEEVFKFPAGIPVEMAAMATINPPTAWRLLRDGDLPEGSWVIQNAANSAVGMHVIEMAQHLGLKTLNVVRRPELVERLQNYGADVVVLEESGYEKKVDELTNGQSILLALNSVGGESAIRLLKCLSEGGTHVTFGAMQFEQVRFPTRSLIFDGITLKGFWMDKWIRENSRARVQIMLDKVFDLMLKGIVKPSVDSVYSLDEYRQALEKAESPRMGKVLFKCSQ